MITLVWKRADRVISSLIHSVDLCVPRVSSVVGRYLRGACGPGLPMAMGPQGPGEPGDRSGPPRRSPRGNVPTPTWEPGADHLVPTEVPGVRVSEAGMEGGGILADLLWARGRRRPALPWDTRL